MIHVEKMWSGFYLVSFTSQEAPADYRSPKPLSAAEVITELLQRGAALSEIEAALEAADKEWISN
jgi:hypothetical protein